MAELDEFRRAWIEEMQSTRRSKKGSADSEKNELLVLTTSGLSALALFEKGEREERAGRLSDSIKMYRQALKMDSNAEDNYRKLIQSRMAGAISESDTGSIASEDANEANQLPKSTSDAHACADSDELEDAEDKSWFTVLPLEIITLIVSMSIYIDISMLTKLATSCKKMNDVVKDASVWKYQCQKAFQSSYIHNLHDLSRYDNDWVTVFMQKPRIRVDGVFISRVNYMRTGYSDSFNQPVHMVTYFRYLRFKNNQFVILTSSEEPHQVVRLLSFESPISGSVFGYWEWISEDQIALSWTDVTKGPHCYECVFKLVQSTPGRQNKLNWGMGFLFVTIHSLLNL